MIIKDHIERGDVLVRCVDKTTFWVHPETLDPYSCGGYDPWCYSDPLPCKTMEWHEWSLKHVAMMMKRAN